MGTSTQKRAPGASSGGTPAPVSRTDPARATADDQDRLGNAALIDDLGVRATQESTAGLLLSGTWDSALLEPVGPITGLPLGQYVLDGPTLDDLFHDSPSLAAALEEAQADGWIVREGVAGEGTYAQPATKEIFVDPDEALQPLAMADTLAHELGHAGYTLEPEIPVDSTDRDEYVRESVMRHLRDEAEATVLELQVRDELLASDPEADIGTSGATADQKQALWEGYKAGGLTRDELIEEIAVLFALGESPSTSPDQDYFEFYAEPYEEAWDANHR